MNIKTLRKNYKELSKIERHSLFISAILRKDKSEEDAVFAASPKSLWEKADFINLYSKVLDLQMIVIIEKANAWINWQTFIEFESERALENSRLALYYFFVYSDAWAAVCEQLKIDAESMAEMMFPNNFLMWRIAFIDDTFREFAFTEAEARDFIGEFAATEGKFGMTLENKIAMFGDFLGLPEK
ncbi:MAG: hypothetical protein WKF92_01965 [Pyrinomonadaceae bacterium]